MLHSDRNQLISAIILASFVISAVHLFVFPLYDASSKVKGKGKGEALPEQRAMISLEKSLCKSNLKPIRVPAAWKSYCPRDGIVTVAQGGRLGNQIWEYASVWAAGRRTGLEAFVPRCIHSSLSSVFEKLSVPPLGFVSHCVAPAADSITALDAWNNTGQSIVLPKYSALPELVLSWFADIRNELTFKASLRERAQRLLRRAADSGSERKTSSPRTFVGVHVRRTDYRSYLWRTRTAELAKPSYFVKAMEYFEKKYEEPIFIVLSDEPAWCEENLAGGREDVVVINEEKGGSPGADLALLAACNHSIIDYGTFGVWGAILAGGETLLYNISKHSSLRVSQLLPDWKVIS